MPMPMPMLTLMLTLTVDYGVDGAEYIDVETVQMLVVVKEVVD